MKTSKLWVYGIFWSAVLTGLLCTACGSSNQVTYRVGGEAAKASIAYKDAEGNTHQEKVSVPWETSFNIGNKFDPELIVTNENPPGAVTCEIWVNERQLGDRESLAHAVCNASFSKRGNSSSSSFTGSSVEVYLTQAEEAIQEDDFEKALSEIEKAIEVVPNYADVHFVRAIVYKNMEELDKALESYDQAIELDPEHVGAYNNRGRVYADMDDLESAIADWTTAIELDPAYVYGYYNRAIAYTELGEIEAAIADVEEVKELTEDSGMLAWAEDMLTGLENISAEVTISTAEMERYTHNLDCSIYNEKLTLKSFSVLYPVDFEITDCRENAENYVTFELNPDGEDSDFAFALGHFTIDAAPGEFETQYGAQGDKLLDTIGPQLGAQLNGKLIDDKPISLEGTTFYRRDYEAEILDIPRLVRLVTIPNFDTGQGLFFLALKKIGTTPENEYPVFDEFTQQIMTSVEFPPAPAAPEEREPPPGNTVTVKGSLEANGEATFFILGSTNASILATVDPGPGFELAIQQATTDQIVASAKDGDTLLTKIPDTGLYRIIVRNLNTSTSDFDAAFMGSIGIAFALNPHYKMVGRLPEGNPLSYTYTGPGGSKLKINIRPHTETPVDLVVKIFNLDDLNEPLLEANETGLGEGEVVDFTLPEGDGDSSVDTYLINVEDAEGNPGKYLLVITTE